MWVWPCWPTEEPFLRDHLTRDPLLRNVHTSTKHFTENCPKISQNVKRGLLQCIISMVIQHRVCVKSVLDVSRDINISMSSYTVSSRLYALSVSSEIRMKVGMCVIASHDLHWVTTDLEMTFDANRGMRAVQNWAYRREDTVVIFQSLEFQQFNCWKSCITAPN